jgi:SAM-dependent methyltransferase
MADIVGAMTARLLVDAGVDAGMRVLDAVVGRRALMYQPDPVDAVRQLVHALRPGGRVIFQDHDSTMTPGRLTPWPLHERVYGRIWRTVERE